MQDSSYAPQGTRCAPRTTFPPGFRLAGRWGAAVNRIRRHPIVARAILRDFFSIALLTCPGCAGFLLTKKNEAQTRDTPCTHAGD